MQFCPRAILSLRAILSPRAILSSCNFDPAPVKFYPSITKKTLIKAFEFAENFLPITDKDRNIIIQSCKSILTHKNKTWEKINADKLFNISMGLFNGAEICDFVRLFLLNELNNSNILNHNEFGLYRDDGMVVIRSKSPKTT